MAGAFITVRRDSRRVLRIPHPPAALLESEIPCVSEGLGFVALGGLLRQLLEDAAMKGRWMRPRSSQREFSTGSGLANGLS